MSSTPDERITECPDCFGTGICKFCKGEGHEWKLTNVTEFMQGTGAAGQTKVACARCRPEPGICAGCSGHGFIKGIEPDDPADGFAAMPRMFGRVSESRGSRSRTESLLKSADHQVWRRSREKGRGGPRVSLSSRLITGDRLALSPPAIRAHGLPELGQAPEVPDAFLPRAEAGITGSLSAVSGNETEGNGPANSICVGGLWSWARRQEILYREDPQPPENFEQLLDEADRQRENSEIDFLAWYSPWATGGDSKWGIYFEEDRFLAYVLSASRKLTSLDEADYLIPALFHEVLIHELVHLRTEIALTELLDLMAIDPRTYEGLRPGSFPGVYYESYRELEFVQGVSGPFEEAIATGAQVEWAGSMEAVDPQSFASYAKYVGDRHRNAPGYQDFGLCLGTDARQAAAACLVSRVVREYLSLGKQVRRFGEEKDDQRAEEFRRSVEQAVGSFDHLPLRSGRWLLGHLDLERVPVYWIGQTEIAEWLSSIPIPEWSWRWAESGSPGSGIGEDPPAIAG